MKNKTIEITISVWLVVILWGSAFVTIRIGLESYSPGAMALLRYMIASIGMLILYLRLPKRNVPTLRELPILILLGVIGIGFYNITLNYGEITVPAGIASFIVGTMPVFTVIASVLFLGEKTNWPIYLGIFVSLIGLGLIAWGEHTGMKFDIGVIYTLLAALAGSFYTVAQKPLLKKYHPIEITAFAIFAGTLMMMFYLPEVIRTVPHASLRATSAVIYMGIFPAAIAYALWSYVLANWLASKAVIYLYAMPIISTVLGVIIIQEVPAWLSVAGGLVALCGAFIVSLDKMRRAKKHLPAE